MNSLALFLVKEAAKIKDWQVRSASLSIILLKLYTKERQVALCFTV